MLPEVVLACKRPRAVVAVWSALLSYGLVVLGYARLQVAVASRRGRGRCREAARWVLAQILQQVAVPDWERAASGCPRVWLHGVR